MSDPILSTQDNLVQLQLEPFFPYEMHDVEKIESCTLAQINGLGYHYYNFVAYRPLVEKNQELSNFPNNFLLSESSKNFSSDNPLKELSQQCATPFLWNELANNAALKKQGFHVFLKCAEKHSVYDGLCIPIHGAGSEWGMLNVAKRYPNAKVSLKTIQTLQLFATALHEVLKRANAVIAEQNKKKNDLSPRERECLDWIAAGKTAWEAAQIIGITESTVAFHIRNTIAKLNASNRTHAVAIAMARCLIQSPQSAK